MTCLCSNLALVPMHHVDMLKPTAACDTFSLCLLYASVVVSHVYFCGAGQHASQLLTSIVKPALPYKRFLERKNKLVLFLPSEAQL